METETTVTPTPRGQTGVVSGGGSGIGELFVAELRAGFKSLR